MIEDRQDAAVESHVQQEALSSWSTQAANKMSKDASWMAADPGVAPDFDVVPCEVDMVWWSPPGSEIARILLNTAARSEV